MDGTNQRYTANKRCVECENYARALKSGRIDGVRGVPLIRAAGDNDIWSDEMAAIHAAAIKKGKERAKGKKPIKHKLCIIVNCGRTASAFGLCHKHYKQQQRKNHANT